VQLFVEGWSLGAPGPSLFRLAAHRRSNKIDDASLLWHCRGPRTGINIRINGAERFSPLSVCFSLLFFHVMPLVPTVICGENATLIWKLKLEGARERKTYVCLIKRRRKFLELLCNLHRFQIRIRSINMSEPRAVIECQVVGTKLPGHPIAAPPYFRSWNAAYMYRYTSIY